MQTDAEHLPDLEGVPEQEQLGLCIRCRANGAGGQPCIADLASVNNVCAAACMTGRPGPALEIEKARGTDHAFIGQPDDSKGSSRVRGAARERGLDVCRDLLLGARHSTPLVQGRILCNRPGKGLGVRWLQRIETDMVALE